MRIAIYSRKSLYTGKGESVENQVQMCREYIRFSFADDEEKDIYVYEDEGYSAKNMNRPRFLEMIRDMELLGFDYIVCYRLDRLSRSVSDFSSLTEHLKKSGVHLICIKEHFDTSSPMGRAMMYITSVFAQLERETLAERVRDNMNMLARTGRWLGGTAPTGYESRGLSEIIIDGKVKTSYMLECNSEIKTVELMYYLFMQEPSVSAVGSELIRRNIKSSVSGKGFSVNGIREILSNPVYCIADEAAYDYFKNNDADLCFGKDKWNGRLGVMAYNKRGYSDGARRNHISEWIVSVGRHKGIVSGREWVSVQKKLHSGSGKHRSSGAGLLSGVLYCSGCGEKMLPKRHSVGSDNFSYICSGKLRGGNAVCNMQNLIGKQTDDIVLRLVNKQLADSPLSDAFYELSVAEKRKIIKLLISKIEWNGEELNIFTIKK